MTYFHIFIIMFLILAKGNVKFSNDPVNNYSRSSRVRESNLNTITMFTYHINKSLFIFTMTSKLGSDDFICNSLIS